MKLKSYLLSLLVMFACSLLVTSCEEDPIDRFGDVSVDGYTLAFDLRVGGQTSRGVNVEVLPSSNDIPYYFGIVLADELNNKSNDEMVAYLLEKNAGSEQIMARHMVTAEQMEAESPLEPSTSYIVYALGYDTQAKKATSELTTKPFKTKKGSGSTVSAPEVEFVGGVEEKEGAYFFAARCTSKDANNAYIGVLATGAYESLKADGVTLETVFDNITGFMDFSQQQGWLEYLNSEEGIALNAGKADGAHREAFLKVTNADGGIAVMWADTKGGQDSWANGSSTPTPGGVTAPEVEFMGGIDDKENVYFFAARCNSKDASGAWIGLLEGGAYEQIKGQGVTLETVFDVLDGAMDFAQKNWLDPLNSDEGIALNAGNVEGDKVFEAFLKVVNEEGGISVMWADTKGAQDAWNNSGAGGGDTPSSDNPLVDFKAGVHQNLVTFAMICMSSDATEAYLLIADKAEFESLDATMEQIMDENLSQAAKFTAEWLSALNSKNGLSLNNKNLDPKKAYAALLDVRNDGGRTIKRADTDSGAITSPRTMVRMTKAFFAAPSYVSTAVTLM